MRLAKNGTRIARLRFGRDAAARKSGAKVAGIGRRDFLARSGMTIAAAMFTGLLPGCAEEGINIPCIVPAAAPTPVAGMTYIRASEIGCALDCDLSTGRNKRTGGHATDDGPTINAALAAASEKNPLTLIIDGSALVSGLFLPAGGYWSIAGLGCGTGFFIKSGTNNDGIHNGGPNAAVPSDPGPPAPPRSSNVTLKNFAINGNRGNGRDGVSTTGSTQGRVNSPDALWYFSINLMNLDNIDIENVVVVNSPSYLMRLSNVGKVNISGCILVGDGPNTDGLHFDGPANDITISNCKITCGDDAIALNCPEGYTGDISRVTVSNCIVNSGTFLMRLHSVDDSTAVGCKIDAVSVTGCSGICEYGGFLVGHGATAKPQSIDHLSISDCQLRAPAVLEIGANFGSVTLDSVVLTPLASKKFPEFALARSSGFSDGCTYSGTNLEIRNCTVYRSGSSPVPAFGIANNSTLASIVFDGFTVASSSEVAQEQAMIDLESGNIGQVVINSVAAGTMKAPVSAGGFGKIGSVSGTGVLATGWAFPDAVIANNVPYISARTGLASIKIDGVIEPYTGPASRRNSD
jgi:hypothetical protein